MNPVVYNPAQTVLPPNAGGSTPNAVPLSRSALYDSLFQRPVFQEPAISGPDNHMAEPHVHESAEKKGIFNALIKDEKKAETARRVSTHLLAAVGLFAAGLVLHNSRLPARTSSFKLLSTDWKEWTKIGLGVAAAGQLNKAFNWTPPPWLGAVMAVGIINPLVLGFKKGLPQFAVMAPLVGAVVQGASWLNKEFSEKITPRLEDKTGRKIPEWLPKVAISAAMIVGGLFAYPRLFKLVAGTGFLGAAAKEAAAANTRTLLGTGGAVCFRGCCPSVICLSEIGEMVGGMRTGHKSAPQFAGQLPGQYQNGAIPGVRFGHESEPAAEPEKPSLVKRILNAPIRVVQWFGEFFSGFFKDMTQLVRGVEQPAPHAHHDHDGHDHGQDHHDHGHDHGHETQAHNR